MNLFKYHLIEIQNKVFKNKNISKKLSKNNDLLFIDSEKKNIHIKKIKTIKLLFFFLILYKFPENRINNGAYIKKENPIAISLNNGGKVSLLV